MIVTIARVADPDRFLEVFETVGVEKRRQHGCRSARVYFDPDDAHRVWSVFDWDAKDYDGFLADPDIPAIARELGIQAPPCTPLPQPSSTPDQLHRESFPMAVTPSQARRFSSAIGDDAVYFGEGIRIAPALGKEVSRSMSAYTSFFHAGTRADLPASYEEVWVVLSGALRVGAEGDAVTVRAGDFVHVPEQAPGVVEALEDTTMVCVSVPAH